MTHFRNLQQFENLDLQLKIFCSCYNKVLEVILTGYSVVPT